MPLKLIIEKPVPSKEEYLAMKKRAKLSNETWKLLDPDRGEYIDYDLGEERP